MLDLYSVSGVTTVIRITVGVAALVTVFALLSLIPFASRDMLIHLMPVLKRAVADCPKNSHRDPLSPKDTCICDTSYQGDPIEDLGDPDKRCNLLELPHCAAYRYGGWEKDGVFTIHFSGFSKKVFCDMTTDNGGWTVVLLRLDSEVSFYRPYKEYILGFGEPEGPYFVGLEALHRRTSPPSGRQEALVRIELYNGTILIASYRSFSVSTYEDGYYLYTEFNDGDAGDGFKKSKNKKFSSPDHIEMKCNSLYPTAGWFSTDCDADSNLLGKRVGQKSFNKFTEMRWMEYKGQDIRTAALLLRPKDFHEKVGNKL